MDKAMIVVGSMKLGGVVSGLFFPLVIVIRFVVRIEGPGWVCRLFFLGRVVGWVHVTLRFLFLGPSTGAIGNQMKSTAATSNWAGCGAIESGPDL